MGLQFRFCVWLSGFPSTVCWGSCHFSLAGSPTPVLRISCLRTCGFVSGFLPSSVGLCICSCAITMSFVTMARGCTLKLDTSSFAIWAPLCFHVNFRFFSALLRMSLFFCRDYIESVDCTELSQKNKPGAILIWGLLCSCFLRGIIRLCVRILSSWSYYFMLALIPINFLLRPFCFMSTILACCVFFFLKNS